MAGAASAPDERSPSVPPAQPTAASATTPAPQRPVAVEASHLGHLEWRNIGPGKLGGRIVDFAVDPEDTDVVYAGTAHAGAWKSIDGGMSWTPVFEKEGSGAIGGVAVAPSNPNVVWIGTGEANGRNLVSTSWGDGVYKSEDGGKSWAHMGLPLSQQIGRIRIHPDDADTVYVSVVGSLWHDSDEHNAARGLWRTRDGGESWEKILSAGEHAGIVDLDIDPRDPDLMYAAAWQRERSEWRWLPRGPESGLFRTTDGGESWRKLANGLPQGESGKVGVSVCAGDPDIVYAIFEASEGGVYRSDDRGASWELRSPQVRGSHWYSQLRCDPNDTETVYALQTALMVSHDGGRTFANEMAGKPVHVDHHALWIDPADSDHLVLGNDGGIYLSRDRGETWHFISMSISQFFEIGVGMQEPFYYVCGGTQDNSSHCGPSATRFEEGIANDDWFQTAGGDGFYAQTDPTDPTIIYSESQNGGIVRYDTLTGERKRIRPVDPHDLRDPGAGGGGSGGGGAGDGVQGGGAAGETGPVEAEDIDEYRWNWSAPILISRWDPATIYLGTQALLRSPDHGDTWETISPDLTRALTYPDQMNDFGTIRVIAESPLRRGLLAVGTDDGLVQISEDGGGSWSTTEALPGVPELALVRRLVLSAHDADTIYVASSSHEYNDFTPYVLKSTDLGQSWESIAAGLPDGSPVRAFAEHPRNPELLFAGTEHGVWASFDGGGRWISIKRNLPTVAIHDMLIHPRDNDLIVGTHGRGIWILDNINALEGLTGEVVESPGHLFPTRPTMMFDRFNRGMGFHGSNYFAAPNPPLGMIIDYWVGPSAEAERAASAGGDTLTIHDGNGGQVRELETPAEGGRPGVHRIVWDMRYDPAWTPLGSDDEGGFGGGGGGGGGTVRSPWVLPSTYEARLTVGGATSSQPIEIYADPLARISDADRRYWHDLQRSLAEILATARAAAATARVIDDVLSQAEDAIAGGARTRAVPDDVHGRVEAVSAEVDTLLRDLNGLSGSASQVYNALQASTTAPTAEQVRLAELAYEQLGDKLTTIERLLAEQMPQISGLLDGLGLPWTMGRPVVLPETARPPQRQR